MVQIQDDFNATIDDLKDPPIPAGEYKVAMIESDLKPSKKTPGCTGFHFLWEIVEGKYKGRRIFQYINNTHPTSEIAVTIGRKEYAAVKLACKKPVIKDTQELHNRPCIANIEIDGDQNKIKGFVIEAEKTKGLKKLEAQDVSLEEDEISFS